MSRHRSGGGRNGWLTVAVLCATLCAAPAPAEWIVESKDGETAIKFGFLVQPWRQALQTPEAANWSYNLFFRRLRLMAGGRIARNVSFFVETDSPFLGRGDPDGNKNIGDIFIQDLVFTFSTGDAFMVDVGLILVPVCYNCNTSAAKLLPVDYEGKLQAGVAWYWMGRNLSLKLGLGRLSREAQPDRDEVVLQLQTYMF